MEKRRQLLKEQKQKEYPPHPKAGLQTGSAGRAYVHGCYTGIRTVLTGGSRADAWSSKQQKATRRALERRREGMPGLPCFLLEGFKCVSGSWDQNSWRGWGSGAGAA